LITTGAYRGSDLFQLDHFRVLSGRLGLFEHARYGSPRIDHGYCLDDNGRALVVIARAASCGIDVPAPLRNRCLDFVLDAQQGFGWSDRQTADGVWRQDSSEDAVGRAIWGLGAAAAWWPEPEGRQRAAAALGKESGFASSWWRPPAYSILGLSTWYRALPQAEVAAGIERWSEMLPRPRQSDGWIWPDDKLRYDNARLPEALMAAGEVLDDMGLIDDGLRLLQWLIEQEAGEKGFSFTPAHGRGPGDPKPAFDQQPLEAWAMADAAMRAAEVTGDHAWITPAGVAVAWFLGENDHRHPMYDTESGACYDGLTEEGVNRNQGAESTLSALGAILAPIRPPRAP